MMPWDILRSCSVPIATVGLLTHLIRHCHQISKCVNCFILHIGYDIEAMAATRCKSAGSPFCRRSYWIAVLCHDLLPFANESLSGEFWWTLLHCDGEKSNYSTVSIQFLAHNLPLLSKSDQSQQSCRNFPSLGEEKKLKALHYFHTDRPAKSNLLTWRMTPVSGHACCCLSCVLKRIFIIIIMILIGPSWIPLIPIEAGISRCTVSLHFWNIRAVKFCAAAYWYTATISRSSCLAKHVRSLCFDTCALWLISGSFVSDACKWHRHIPGMNSTVLVWLTTTIKGANMLKKTASVTIVTSWSSTSFCLEL